MSDILKALLILFATAVAGGIALIFILVCAGIGGLSGGGSPRIVTGQVGVLRSGAGDVMVCVTSADFDRSIQLSIASDAAGLAEMERKGRLFVVTDGTRARVIRTRFASSEVRVTEGIHEGKSGFVPAEFIVTK